MDGSGRDTAHLEGGDTIEHISCADLAAPAAPPRPAERRPILKALGPYAPLAMHNLRDFRPDLQSAIELLHMAGFDGEAYVLAASMEGAYGTAVEMLSAIGGAVLRVERALGSDIPREVQSAFERALAEVRKAIPSLN